MGLTKLQIVAYKDNKFSSQTGNKFVMMVNPTQYKEEKGIRYNLEDAMEGGNNPTYQGYDDGKLSFEFLLDTTGVISGGEKKELPQIIKDLEKTVYDYVGDAHEPPYLKVEWGTLNFTGRTDSLTTNYVLFSPEGNPLRAKINLKLVCYVDIVTQEKEKNKKSPDLSHLVVIKAGDTLPNLCHQIYQDMSYCTEVARINDLPGFRYLEPGTKVFFPPLSNK